MNEWQLRSAEVQVGDVRRAREQSARENQQAVYASECRDSVHLYSYGLYGALKPTQSQKCPYALKPLA